MITKATPADVGCYVAGTWGQYGLARMIVVAVAEFGFDESDVIDLANRKLGEMDYETTEYLTDDEHTWLSDAGDEVEQWLNDNVAPEDHYFGWFDGEFFLQSVDWWDEGSY